MKQYCIKLISILLIYSCYFPSIYAGKLNVYAVHNAISFSSLLSSSQFNNLFPLRDQFYSYSSLLSAVHNLAQLKIKIERRGPYLCKITRTDLRNGTQTVIREDQGWNEAWAKQKEYKVEEVNYGTFCNGPEASMNKKELAAFFAQTAHETRHGADGSFKDGLMLKQELNSSNPYLTENKIYPGVEGKKYYGRGPLQLSYNGNYGAASEVIFGDKGKLLSDPDLLVKDPVTAFATAVYFWMTPQSSKPSAHQVITGAWQPNAEEKVKGWTDGFAMVTNIINGAIECNHGEEVPAMKNRISYYRYFLKAFGLTDTRQCSCAAMAPFK